MMAAETKKIEKYDKLTDEQKADPKNIKSLERASSELDRFGRRYEAAGKMLEDSNKTVQDAISKAIEKGITGKLGGSINVSMNGPMQATERGFIKGYADHVKDFEKMVGGAPGTGNHTVLFNFKAGRANYMVGHDTVNLDYPGRSVIFHELGHWWEDKSPAVHNAALAFLENRTYGEKLRSLNEIKGTTGHDRHEVARPDKFLEPYTGRDYHGHATEVVSMGFQHLAEDPAGFFKNDPDHFHFTLGVIRLGHGLPSKEEISRH